MIHKQSLEITTLNQIELHEDASDDAKVVCLVPGNTKIELLEVKNQWVLVRALHQQGSVRQDCLPEFQSIQRALKRERADLVPSRKLKLVRTFVQKALEKRPGLRGDLKARIDRLFANVELLNGLAAAAYGFLRALPGAERRFDHQDSLLSAASQWMPRPQSFKGLFPAEIPGEIDFPRRPPLPFDDSCFIDPDVYAALFTAIALRSAPGNTQLEAIEAQWRLISPLVPLLRDLEIAETFYKSMEATLKVQSGINQSFQSFVKDIELFAAVESNYGPSMEQARLISGDFIPGFALPGFEIPGLPGFDACRIERWFDTTRLLACICEESYRIDRIVNIDRPLFDGSEHVGEACTGDWIRIVGEGFGFSRDWPVGLGQSDVLFEGEGFSDVLAIEYRNWSEREIVVRVPESMQSGYLSLRILCTHTSGDCTGLVYRGFEAGSNRRLDLIPASELVQVSTETFLNGRSVYPASAGRRFGLTALRCEGAILGIVADNVESITLTESTGAEIEVPGGSPGIRRRIDTEVTLSANEDRELSLQLNGGCGLPPVFQVIEQRKYWLFIKHVIPTTLSAGQTVTYPLALSCSPSDWGFTEAVVEISSSDEMVLRVDETRVVFSGDELEKEIRVRGQAICGSAVLTFRLSEGSRPDILEEDEIEFQIPVAVIDELRVLSAEAPYGLGPCGMNQVDLNVSCLPEPATVQGIVETPEHGEIGTLIYAEIMSREGNSARVRLSWYGTTSSGARLLFGIRAGYGYSPNFTSVISSNKIELRATEAPRMRIQSFIAEPPNASDIFIMGRLRAEVYHARRIEIYRMRLRTLGGHERGEIIANATSGDRCSSEPLVIDQMERYAGYSRFIIVAYDFDSAGFDPDDAGPRTQRRELTIDYLEPPAGESPPPITYRSVRIDNYATLKVNVYVSKDLAEFEIKSTLREYSRTGPDSYTVEFEADKVYHIALWSITSADDLGGECHGDFSDNAFCLKGIILPDRPDTFYTFLGDPEGLNDFYQILGGT